MPGKTRKQLVFSKTGGHATGRPRALREPLRLRRREPDMEPEREETTTRRGAGRAARTRLQPLITECLLDLRVLGRSPRTLGWYSQKMRWYLEEGGGVQTLEEFTAFELKRYLASLQDRGLAENSVKHAHTVAKAFANWAAREGHPVDEGYESHVQMFFSEASGWSCRKVSRASTQIPIVRLDRGNRVGETRMMPAWASPKARNC